MARVEFRDGTRDIPDHVRDLMRGLDTIRFTYEQALRLAQKKVLRDKLNETQQDIISRHIRDLQQ